MIERFLMWLTHHPFAENLYRFFDAKDKR